MYVTLFNLGEVQSKLKLINGKQLANVIGNPNYPKQVNPGLPEGLIFDSADVIDAKYQERYSAEELPSPTSYKADSLELVYLFSNTNQQFLAPVYQITGKGRIVFKGNDFNVPGLINASAIDPDYVYIPSNILYAD
jgi:hypothetical protein